MDGNPEQPAKCSFASPGSRHSATRVPFHFSAQCSALSALQCNSSRLEEEDGFLKRGIVLAPRQRAGMCHQGSRIPLFSVRVPRLRRRGAFQQGAGGWAVLRLAWSRIEEGVDSGSLVGPPCQGRSSSYTASSRSLVCLSQSISAVLDNTMVRSAKSSPLQLIP